MIETKNIIVIKKKESKGETRESQRKTIILYNACELVAKNKKSKKLSVEKKLNGKFDAICERRQIS
jgi:hypothetical protein